MCVLEGFREWVTDAAYDQKLLFACECFAKGPVCWKEGTALLSIGWWTWFGVDDIRGEMDRSVSQFESGRDRGGMYRGTMPFFLLLETAR